jgi:hypothetical protein
VDYNAKLAKQLAKDNAQELKATKQKSAQLVADLLAAVAIQAAGENIPEEL